MAGEQAPIVYAKQLRVLNTSEEPHFVTADVPLALWSEIPGPFGALSVMMADEVLLPIDRSHCLLLNHPAAEADRGPETIEQVDAGRVEQINRRVIDQAHRFVFCHPDEADGTQSLLRDI